MPSDWENALDDMLWHNVMLPFVGVKELRIVLSLTFELLQALESLAGGLAMELLPWPQALDSWLEVPQHSSITTRREQPCNKYVSMFLKTLRIRGSPHSY